MQGWTCRNLSLLKHRTRKWNLLHLGLWRSFITHALRKSKTDRRFYSWDDCMLAAAVCSNRALFRNMHLFKNWSKETAARYSAAFWSNIWSLDNRTISQFNQRAKIDPITMASSTSKLRHSNIDFSRHSAHRANLTSTRNSIDYSLIPW